MENTTPRYPIGWNTMQFRDTPGLRENMPLAPKNTIRIFGELPRGNTLEKVIKENNLDLDHISTIDIVVPVPGTRGTLIINNGDGEKKYNISFGISTSLVIQSNTDAMKVIA